MDFSTERFQQRDVITSPSMAPPWLCGYESNGVKFLYSIGIMLDFLLQKQNEAMLSKLPGYGGPTALPLQAADRLMVRGPMETEEQLAARLQDALSAWSIAGSRRAVLSQVQAYLAGTSPGVSVDLPECLIVGGISSTASWDTVFGSMAQGATPARARVSPPNWDWDGTYAEWRAWLVLFMNRVPTGLAGSAASIASIGGSGVPGVTSGFARVNNVAGITADNIQDYLELSNTATFANEGVFQIVDVPSLNTAIIANPRAVAPDANNGSLVWNISRYPFIGPAPVWGSPDFVWGNTHTWGLDCSAYVIDSIRQIVQRWKSAGTYYQNILVSFDGGNGSAGREFSPLSAQGGGNPNGTWATPGTYVDGVIVPSRIANTPASCVCRGTGVSRNCYKDNFT
jgi:hypothetical protein